MRVLRDDFTSLASLLPWTTPLSMESSDRNLPNYSLPSPNTTSANTTQTAALLICRPLAVTCSPVESENSIIRLYVWWYLLARHRRGQRLWCWEPSGRWQVSAKRPNYTSPSRNFCAYPLWHGRPCGKPNLPRHSRLAPTGQAGELFLALGPWRRLRLPSSYSSRFLPQYFCSEHN